MEEWGEGQKNGGRGEEERRIERSVEFKKIA